MKTLIERLPPSGSAVLFLLTMIGGAAAVFSATILLVHFRPTVEINPAALLLGLAISSCAVLGHRSSFRPNRRSPPVAPDCGFDAGEAGNILIVPSWVSINEPGPQRV